MEYGLLGEKLSHSFSPQIHAQLADYEYTLKSLPEEELASFLKARDFRGLNVTIPYKKAVIAHLDSLSPIAQRIGAVNTIVNRGGTLYGDNTDYAGLCYAISPCRHSPGAKEKCPSGQRGDLQNGLCGSAKTLAPGEIFVISRTGAHNYQNLSLHADAQVILNTTPVGMFPSNGCAPLPRPISRAGGRGRCDL